MKKLLMLTVFLLLIALLTLFAACGDQTDTTTETTGGTGTTTDMDSVSGNTVTSTEPDEPEVISATASYADGVLKVTVVASSATLKDASLVLLSDVAYRDSWSEHPDQVLDIAQFTLDADGKGTYGFSLDAERLPVCVLLTVNHKNYLLEVKS